MYCVIFYSSQMCSLLCISLRIIRHTPDVFTRQNSFVYTVVSLFGNSRYIDSSRIKVTVSSDIKATIFRQRAKLCLYQPRQPQTTPFQRLKPRCSTDPSTTAGPISVHSRDGFLHPSVATTHRFLINIAID